MRLQVVELRTTVADEPGADLPRALLADLVAGLGRGSWELNLVLVDDDAMADLNARHYGGEGVTDVLSFSYLEEAGRGEPQLAAGEGGAAADLWLPVAPAGQPALAGEIVLALDYVEDRCRRRAWDRTTELALLVVHGALHVLGWRHDDAEQTRAMRAREAEQLARHGLHHPLLETGGGA